MTTLYEDGLKAARNERVVIWTPGIDGDGDEVLCTSTFEIRPRSADLLYSEDRNLRASVLIGVAQVARDGLRDRWGVEGT